MFHWSFVSVFVWAVAVVNAHGESQEQQQHQLHFLPPHPLSGQVVAAEDMMMMATMLGHYGKPPSECQPDELAFEISGVPGMVRDTRGLTLRSQTLSVLGCLYPKKHDSHASDFIVISLFLIAFVMP